MSSDRFRRGGSVARFVVDGAALDPRAESFCQAMREHRFRSIETAASEEQSLGWVTPLDPTGDHFAPEDLDRQVGTWLRVRIDKKALPSKWVSIHRAAAERAMGRPLSAREKRDLKVDLMQKLLPRVLPSVNLVDALYSAERKLVLLFSTSKAVKEGFQKLFQQSFGARLIEADPYVSATLARITRDQQAYLDKVSPVQWPIAKRDGAGAGAGAGARTGAAASAGDEANGSGAHAIRVTRGAPPAAATSAEHDDSENHDAGHDVPELLVEGEA